MKETKIRGLKIEFDSDYIKIIDAYQIRNTEKMAHIIRETIDKMDFCFIERSTTSMEREWSARSRLYRWGFKKSMKDYVIKDYNNKFKKAFFFILGFEQIKIIEKIKDRIKKIRIRIAEEKYYKYIEKHRNYMLKAYLEMLTCPVILELGEDALNGLRQRVILHDLSKYTNEEFNAYRKHYYPINKQEKEDNLENFDRAWKHHWNTNAHHWQHRRNKTNFSKDNLEDVVNVLENLCD